MKFLKNIFFAFVLFSAFTFSQGVQNYAELGNFKLENGEIIKNCKIGYRTFGTLNGNKSNAVIYPTWFGGTSANIASLLGADKLVDTTKYFLIAIDAFGNGVSSSPSNSLLQMNDSFPVFSIHDMVIAQHKFLTEKLGIKHLFAAVGGSMGSMQVFDWLVSYPDFTDKAVAYVCTPRSSTYELLSWNILLSEIETYKKYNVPEKEILKNVNMPLSLLGKTPEAIIDENSYENFPKLLKSFDKEPSKVFTSSNFASQVRAMIGHNISKKFDNSLEKAASVIKAKVLIIVSLRDNIINPKTALDFAKLINAEVLTLDSKYGHLAVGYEIPKCGKAINGFLAK
jgi:Homoserine acetyltransferase